MLLEVEIVEYPGGKSIRVWQELVVSRPGEGHDFSKFWNRLIVSACRVSVVSLGWILFSYGLQMDQEILMDQFEEISQTQIFVLVRMFRIGIIYEGDATLTYINGLCDISILT